MSHGVHLAAILDFVIRELRKLIISITFEPSDIETQTIPLVSYKSGMRNPLRRLFCNRNNIMPQIEQNINLKHLWSIAMDNSGTSIAKL